MKKFLKLATIPAAFLIIGLTTGCNAAKKEIALITDVGDIDDGSFNQASWDAIKSYCTDNKITYDYYRPFNDSDFARNCAIKQAVYKGAKVIVCPGFKFASAVNEAQYKYKDVKFLLIDSSTNDYVRDNCVCVGYKCEYSGLLAGAAVIDDYMTYDKENGGIRDNYNFGYCGGMANDGVLQFGFGFVQGLVQGAKYFVENKIESDTKKYPNINVKYNYAGVFAQDDNAAARMKGWYANGTQAVFACGGKLYQSITEAVSDYNKKNGTEFKEGEAKRDAARWIGVDSDQYEGFTNGSFEKATIITSALKGLGTTIKSTLDCYRNDKWDSIGGAVGKAENVMHFSNTLDKDGKVTATAEKNCKDYIDSHTLTWEDQNWEVQPCKQDENEYIIKYRSKGTSEWKEYHDQIKSWSLGLADTFGRDETKQLDYVGIPEVTKKDSKVLRGFFNFTIDQYNHLKELSQTTACYGADGLDLVDDSGNKKPARSKGDPLFMSDSANYYVMVDDKLVSFNKQYFNEYPAEKINVEVI